MMIMMWGCPVFLAVFFPHHHTAGDWQEQWALQAEALCTSKCPFKETRSHNAPGWHTKPNCKVTSLSTWMFEFFGRSVLKVTSILCATGAECCVVRPNTRVHHLCPRPSSFEAIHRLQHSRLQPLNVTTWTHNFSTLQRCLFGRRLDRTVGLKTVRNSWNCESCWRLRC